MLNYAKNMNNHLKKSVMFCKYLQQKHQQQQQKATLMCFKNKKIDHGKFVIVTAQLQLQFNLSWCDLILTLHINSPPPQLLSLGTQNWSSNGWNKKKWFRGFTLNKTKPNQTNRTTMLIQNYIVVTAQLQDIDREDKNPNVRRGNKSSGECWY